nr:S8 family peptidase [Chitinivorax tropicus]
MPKQVAVLVFTLFSASAFAAGEANGSDRTDRMIVKYKSSSLESMSARTSASMMAERMASAQRIGQQMGFSLRTLRQTATGAQVLTLNRKASVEEVSQLAANLKAQDPNVEYAEPDRIKHAMLTPNDSRFSEQWDLTEATGGMRLPQAWDLSTGQGITVAVIDTGYRPHSDLSANLLPGYDFITDTFVSVDGDGRDSDARDPGTVTKAGECGGGEPKWDLTSSWHGTHVAGTIAALTNNRVGVAGVAFDARVLPLRVLGKCGGYTSDIADAIIWAAGGAVDGVPANSNRARVINLSLGGKGSCEITTQNAINSARNNGAVVVVAAGNDNVNAGGFSPANCQGTITVASTNRAGGHAYYSNFGSVIDVSAPGGETNVTDANGILSTVDIGQATPVGEGYSFYEGTSMAAPHVAGVAALMLSRNPSLTPDQVESLLKSTARTFPATCSQCGAGIVDANAAVRAADSDTTPPGSGGETEPNDSLSGANIISTSGTVQANIGSSRDVDYFKVTLPAGKTLRASMTPGSGSADYDVYLYNDAGSLLSSSEAGAGRVDTVSGANSGSRSVTRYVAVKYYSGGTGSSSGKYSIQFSW